MSSENDSGDFKRDDGSLSEAQLQSANSWETADLGNKQRNEKFLRLMGASKKEHHGKIIIGDHKPIHKRERNEEKNLAEELEDQYEHSMEHRLVGGRRGHLGLGYRPDSEEKKDKVEADEEVGVEAKPEGSMEDEIGQTGTKDEEKNVSRTDERKKSERDRKRESLDKSSESDNKKMKFVKSSS